MKCCANPGCGRWHKGRRPTCCSGCDSFSRGRTMTRLHSRRCQRMQRNYWRGRQLTSQADADFCSTVGCDRMSRPGYSACCSHCGHARGNQHSRRCNRQQAQLHLHPWMEQMPTMGTAGNAAARAGMMSAGSNGLTLNNERPSESGSGSAQVIVISDSEQSEASSDAPLAPAGVVCYYTDTGKVDRGCIHSPGSIRGSQC